MRTISHQFASLETLARARRWLIELGFDPAQIESHTDGIPRLGLTVKPEQVDEVQQVINAAELTDPKGWPSFWDTARQTHVYPCAPEPAAPPEFLHAHSTAVGWHPPDDQPHVLDTTDVTETREATDPSS